MMETKKTNKNKLCIIAAKNLCDVIGSNNKLPWHLPADMQHFKELTTGHTVVMGRKTYQSIGKALPGRRNIVISSQKLDLPDCEVMTLHQFIYMQPSIDDTVYVIGGANLFAVMLSLADAMYITVIHGYSNGDTYMPMSHSKWNVTAIERHKADADNKFDYDFITYERVQDEEFNSIKSYWLTMSMMHVVDQRPKLYSNQLHASSKRQRKHNNNQNNNHGKEN